MIGTGKRVRENWRATKRTELSFALPGVANEAAAQNAKVISESTVIEGPLGVCSLVTQCRYDSHHTLSHLRCLNVLTYPLAFCDCTDEIFFFIYGFPTRLASRFVQSRQECCIKTTMF